jgi:hypothetical protein
VSKLLVVIWVVLMPAAAAAQDVSWRFKAVPLTAHLEPPRGALRIFQPVAPAAGKRDSLKNGAVIGALVGAAALGGFGLYLCHALDDTGDPDCFPTVLGIAAIGAGIGLSAGVAIDVLLARQAGTAFRLHVRF